MTFGKKRIDREFVDRARDRLTTLAHSDPTKGISRKDTISELSEELREVIDKHGIEAAVAALNSDGIVFPVATVTTYLHQLAQMDDVKAMTSGKLAENDMKTGPVVDNDRPTSAPTKPIHVSPNKASSQQIGRREDPDRKGKTAVHLTDALDKQDDKPPKQLGLISRKGSFAIRPDSDDL